MAGRRESNQLTFTRCIKCDTAVMGIIPPTKRLVHHDDGNHTWEDWNPAGEAPAPRPEHRTVEMWKTVRNALEYIRTVEFYLGYLPEKPRRYDDDAVRINLEDAREALGELALALAEGGDS